MYEPCRASPYPSRNSPTNRGSHVLVMGKLAIVCHCVTFQDSSHHKGSRITFGSIDEAKTTPSTENILTLYQQRRSHTCNYYFRGMQANHGI